MFFCLNSRRLCGFPLLILNLVLIKIVLILSNDEVLEFFGKILGFGDYLPMDFLDDQYCVEYNFLEASESFRISDGLEPVSLTTHATSDMLKDLENMPNLWDGPISVGIFIDIDSHKVLEYLMDLHRCQNEFGEKVTVHFAYRKSAFQTTCPTIDIPRNNISCQVFFRNKRKIVEQIRSPFFLYPYNLMRNIARKGAKSNLHFLMDGDMIVSEGMAQKIKPIANKMLNGKDKNVLLVRRFENVKGTVIPRTVEDLKVSIMGNRTFEFHHKFWFTGHQIKNLPHWFISSKGRMEVTSWKISYSNPNWEPQPILHRNSPYGPDYIPSRIKTMQSMIYKLCRAGYTFHVLTHVFNVQEGVKLENTIFSQAVALHQQINSKERAYKRYTKEINELYPETLEKCGEFYL